MRAGFAWAFGVASVVALALGLTRLLDPVAPPSDAPGFASLAVGVLFAFATAALLTRPAWWHWWFPAAWIGLDLAALFLAYKDTLVPEIRFFGPFDFALQVLLHLLIAPIEIFLGFAVGFVEPNAWKIVLACLSIALLGAELIRRRLWPRTSREPAGVNGGSRAGR